MDLNSVATSNVANVDNVAGSAKAQLQVGLLRKMLDSQETEAAALMNMLQGKGQNLDIRV